MAYMTDLESQRLGLFRIIEQMKTNPEKATQLLNESKAVMAGVVSQQSGIEKDVGLTIEVLLAVTKTLHEINMKQNKEIEDLRTNLNNALGRISKLEEKRSFDQPEKMT